PLPDHRSHRDQPPQRGGRPRGGAPRRALRQGRLRPHCDHGAGQLERDARDPQGRRRVRRSAAGPDAGVNMRTKRSSGYSLIELLLAMALFSALSTGLIALLARSSEFLASGASQTETMDSIGTFAQAFGADVAAMASRPDSDTGLPAVRLYCDSADCDVN